MHFGNKYEITTDLPSARAHHLKSVRGTLIALVLIPAWLGYSRPRVDLPPLVITRVANIYFFFFLDNFFLKQEKQQVGNQIFFICIFFSFLNTIMFSSTKEENNHRHLA